MDASSTWTSEDAAGNFVQLLKQAKNEGPQVIMDASGVYVLQAQDSQKAADVAQALLKLRAQGQK